MNIYHKPLLSIIIAVYKAEKTLYRCLDSIFSQRSELDVPEEVEVIAVNDASPDDCEKVLWHYRETQPDLKVITHLENKREANTRNTGIDASCGEYFTFLDADDEYTQNALKTIVTAIKNVHPDLIHYCYSKYTPDGKFISRTSFQNPGLHITDAIDEPTLCAVYHDTAFGIMTSGGVYRRETFPELRYSPEFPISPDRHFGWEFFRRCRNVLQIDEPLYIYYQYENSISHQVTAEAVSGLLRLDRIFWKEFHSHPVFKSAARYGFRRLFPGVIGWHFAIACGKKDSERYLGVEYFITLNDYLDENARAELGLGYWWLKCAVLLHSTIMVRIYRKWMFQFWVSLKSRFS